MTSNLPPLPSRSELVIVGAGLVGLATAYRYLQARPGTQVLVLEKDSQIASQQSTHNSGVLHSGLYYKPGSEKARLCVRGLQQMVEFCRLHNVAHDICGKIVVATTPEEETRLDNLFERGTKNGLEGLRRLCREEIHEIEPHAAGIAAIRVPQEGIVDYQGVAHALATEIERLGGRIATETRLLRVFEETGGLRVVTSRGDYTTSELINCAGLHSDHVVQHCGHSRPARLIPFRGEYYRIKRARQHLVQHLIYPVPDSKFPFLGVHFTRLIHGGVEAGPNAVLAFAREGYRKFDFRMDEFMDAVTFPGLWRFLARHAVMATQEMYRSMIKSAFCASLQKLVPEIQEEDLEPGGAGVRAQAMYPNGRLVEDFLFVRQNRILHVVNAPSPAATASLAIGERIVQEASAHRVMK